MSDLYSENVIITGGFYSMHAVTKYGMLGYVGDLPSLQVGRYGHGCGSYVRERDSAQVVLF